MRFGVISAFGAYAIIGSLGLIFSSLVAGWFGFWAFSVIWLMGAFVIRTAVNGTK